MGDQPALEVFDRVQLAIDAAKDEEEQFALEKSAEDPDSGLLIRAFAEWASSAYTAGQTLRPSADLRRLMRDKLGTAVDDDAASAVARLPFVRPYLDIKLAEDGLRRMEQGTDRMIELLDYLIAADLSRRAEDYLSRVATLFIWGFDEEAVALAGAVLETALDDRLPEDAPEVRALNLTKRNAAALIEVCGPKRLGLIDERTRADAHKLRNSRNDMIHNAAGSQLLKPMDAIRTLGSVLARLF